MPSNPWLAFAAGESPVERARDARRVWEEFLADGRADGARRPIVDSWLRSAIAGLHPAHSRAPTVADRSEAAERWQAHRLGPALPVIRRWLGRLAGESEQVIVVSDADGLLLRVEGDVRVRSAAADAINFVEGALWSELGAGTNAVGTALAADHPIQVHAAEHYSEVVHEWTCSAAPIHDPEDGALLGAVDLTGLAPTASPETAAAVLAAARAIEADLRVRMQLRDARLRLRYLDRMRSARGRLALVSGSGRVIVDDPDGFVRAERVELPPDGGDVVLPDGRRAVAELVDGEDAFLLRELDGARRGDRRDLREWRRAQVELSSLAAEQAALRRVATLVAGRATAEELFAVVAEEVALLLRADRAAVVRHEPGSESLTVISSWTNPPGQELPSGTRLSLAGDSVALRVLRSGRPARVDGSDGLSGPVIEAVVETLGAPPRSTVGAPILLDGRVWGALIATSLGPEPFPEGAESRLMAFVELVEAAIANAVGRAELEASRARLVAAADDTRRRLERDLHDGAQQRLVSLALRLQEVEAAVPPELDGLRRELRSVSEAAAATIEELRRLSQGLHPAVLTLRGLAAALRELARRSPLPVELELATDSRFAAPLETAAYYVASEALTNAAKHAQASGVQIALAESDGLLRIAIHDDGVGGADPTRGSGLIGLRDRVEAVGGTFVVDSRAGAGTAVLAAFPLD